MESFGVKLTSGKIMWVAADEADCRDGAVVFYRVYEGRRIVVAGFSLAHINHFGVPSAFSQADPPALPPA
jgi:hypothetical protein